MGHFIAEPLRLWPGGIIPYEVETTFAHSRDAADPESALSYIQRAVQEWNDKTIVQLVPRRGQEDYVVFAPTEEVSQSEYIGS